MSRPHVIAAALLLALTMPPLQASAADQDRERDLPDRIELPNGWQPEGITTDGKYLYVGSLADGAIWRARPETGKGKVLEDGADGSIAVGVEYDEQRNLLWVAGGPTGEVRAHDAASGRLRATFTFPGTRFINDLVVTDGAVYATDSMNHELAVVRLPGDVRARRLEAGAEATTLPLSGDEVHVPNAFNNNGIVESDGRLLTVQSVTGLLFEVDPVTGRTTAVDLGGYSLVNGDGLEIDDDTLWVVRNRNNLVARLHLDEDLGSATLESEITSGDLDVPTTVAALGESLWAVNARFGTPPTPDTAYWVTRLPQR